jgi:hypothetical protein
MLVQVGGAVVEDGVFAVPGIAGARVDDARIQAR